MRLAYLAPAALGLLLVGCGPDEPEVVTPPPATTEQQPIVPTAPPDMPPAGQGTGTMPPADEPEPGMMNPPAPDNGSGLGTSSGAGTAPNPSGPGQ